MNLTVALATYNEENNLKDCLESIVGFASEIVIVDGSSTDRTVEIAKKFNAVIKVTDNPKIFHINKQKAIDMARNDWILQLDADERVSPELASEIKKIINFTDEEIKEYQVNILDKKLFFRHQRLLEKRDGRIGTADGSCVAFFIPRLNYFLGRYLKHGGVYPDGVIRLVKKGSAHFPCVSLHEQIEIDGKVGWLQNPLFHLDSPTFKRYLQRNDRYTSLMATELKDKKQSILLPIKYIIYEPINWFMLTYFRHKGFLDGYQGFVFSLFSSLRFPKAYLKYRKIIYEK